MTVAATSQEAWPEVAAGVPKGATAGAAVERRQASACRCTRAASQDAEVSEHVCRRSASFFPFDVVCEEIAKQFGSGARKFRIASSPTVLAMTH